MATSFTVHGLLLGAGIAFGVLAAGRGPAPAREVAMRFEPATPQDPEPIEDLEPLESAFPDAAEPELSESEVWSLPEVSAEEPEEAAPSLRCVDWIPARPVAIGALVAKSAAAREPTPSEPPLVQALPAPVIVAAVPLATPAPGYPRLSRRAGEEGTVSCRLHVTASGAVERVEVLESSGYERLDRATQEALRAWRFEPRRENGRAVPCTLMHRVQFRLSEG